MAYIDNLYIHVTDESISESVDSTTHPVETGIDITDTVKKRPKQISISGLIVNNENMMAPWIVSSLEILMRKGALVKYSGRNVVSNMQIQSFDHSYPNTVSGGCEFDMVLQEVRIARSSYKAPTVKNSGSSKAKTKPKTPTTPVPAVSSIKVGDIVIFTGGNVYVSSDAKNPAAKRNKSTCKVTLIANYSYSVHQYHLISTDGGRVYGWVDKSNIQTKSGTTLKSLTAKMAKQILNGDKKAVYHIVKKGDTVYNLVNVNYKTLGKAIEWVMEKNSDCFSKKGDPTTLIAGKKLLVGYKT